MGQVYSNDGLRQICLGARTQKANAALTQNAATNLFTVAGGLVAVTGVIGVVSSVIANTASLAVKLQHTPSGGSAGDLCGSTVIQADAVGTFYSLTSAVPTDLLSVASVSSIGGTPVAASEVPSVTYVGMLWRPIVLPIGTLSMLCSNHSPGTGKVDWTMTWVPLTGSGNVTAA